MSASKTFSLPEPYLHDMVPYLFANKVGILLFAPILVKISFFLVKMVFSLKALITVIL